MQGHTRKHHTDECYSIHERSKNNDSEESTDWRDAAQEAFGEIPGTALNLRGLRNREGMTQEQLGQIIGVEQSNVSKMERGERLIGVKIAKRLQKAFNIDYRLFL